VPQRLVKGHLVSTAPAPFRLRTVVNAPDALVVQLPDGRLVTGGTLDGGDETPDPDPAVTDAIEERLHALLPATTATAVTHGWCCFRPMAADGQPVIDRVAGTDDAWVTCGHYRTGILMAPATGAALAAWIASGQMPPEVSTFGAARFAAG
jgi:glycine oxidase